MKRLALVLVACIAMALGACAKPRVVTQPEVPPLAPPAPPPRVVAPPDTEEPEPPAKTPDAPARRPARTVPRVEAPHEAPKPEAEKPPVKPPAPPAPVEPPGGAVLQTAPPSTANQMEQAAVRLLNQAQADLGKVSRNNLNDDLKGQYDQAQRFIEQGRQALKEHNAVLASKLADKASTMAAAIASAVGR